MDKALDHAIRTRAQSLCEYCLMPQSASRLTFPIDHIIARQHGGQTVIENLALCCGRCNRYKGPNLAGIDADSGQITRLFNPRSDHWDQHFMYEGPVLVGLTAIARVTIATLSINHPYAIATRQALIDEGAFPPQR